MIEKAKKQDNCKVVFEHVSIDCLNGTAETKVFSNFPVTIEGKVFYVGNSQFTVKLKDVEKLDLEPNGLRLKDSKNQRLFDCKFVGCRDSEWKSFQRLAEKLIRKRDEKLGKATSATAITKASQKHTRKATAGRGGPRKMYGSKRYRPSSLISTNSIWSDEEDELEKEKNAPQDSGDVDDDEDEPERFVVDKPEYDEDGEQEDEEVEDPLELAATKTPQSKGDRQTRRRLKKVKAKDSKSKADSDSEDEIFQEEPKPKVSTPYLGHRVVTPHEHAVVVDDENEDEEKENMEDQEKLQSTPKGQKKLDSFFSKAQMTKSENTIDNKKAQKMVTPKSANSPLARGNNLVAVKSSSSTVRKSSQSISQMLSPTAKKQNATEINSSPSSLGDAHSRIAEHPTTSTKKKFPKKYLWSSMDDDDDAEPLNAETTTACESPSALTQREKKRPRLLESSDSKSKRFSLKQRSYFTSAATLPRTPSISDAVVVESPYRGLKNMGNTCYLNSGIQMLCSLPGFIRAIEGKGGNLAEAFYSTAKDLLNDTSKPGVALSAKTVKAAMDQKSDKFLGFEQRDAHEFLGDLIDVLHEELRKGNAEDKDADKTEANQPKDDNMETDEGEAEATSSKTASVHKVENDRTPADDYFRCNIEVCLTCLNCGYSRTKEEIYRHLSLDIEHHEDEEKENVEQSIQKSLELFFKPEKREIKCEKCEEGKTASQTLRLLNRPKALLLHLKRFVYEEKPIALTSTNKEEQGSVQASGEDKTRPRHQVEITFRKNRAPVVITEHLSLEKFIGEDSRTVSKNADSSSGNLYSIKSLVYHIGARASSGHYTADAIRICSKKRYKEDEEEESAQGGHAEKDSTAAKSEWVNFDDARTTVTTLSEILASERRRKTAYMILYTLE